MSDRTVPLPRQNVAYANRQAHHPPVPDAVTNLSLGTRRVAESEGRRMLRMKVKRHRERHAAACRTIKG